MDFSRVSSSSKIYVILLIIAVAILLLTASITFKQIKMLQASADRVAHTLEVDMAIGNLFSHYIRMESEEFRAVLLKKRISESSWKDHKLASDISFKTLEELVSSHPVQKSRLATVKKLQDTLYIALMDMDESIPNETVIPESTRKKLLKISETLEEIREIKNNMILEEQRLMVERKKEYDSRSYFTPLISLIIALFALGVFVLSFIKIYQNKQRIKTSEAFLQSLLRTTDNIVNYYEPIYNASGELADFRIVFANECNRDYLGLEPDEIVGKSVSEVFPFLLLNGELEKMIGTFNEQQQVQFDRQVILHGEKMWFQSIVSPMGRGIMVTIRNFTEREEAAEKLRLLNEELLKNNQELKDTEAFLEGILRSTDNVIMSFKPINDKAGNIVDFEYLFVNDRMEGISGDHPALMIGKKVSEVNPTIFKSGVFEKMVRCFVENIKVDYETSYVKDRKKSWFHGTAIRSGNSVTVTSRDISSEKNTLEKLQQLNEQLQIQNSIFKDAESVASIGSYIWYLDDGSAQISDNFYKILGHKPNSFEVSYNQYRQFVHPEDLEIYDRLGRETTEKGQSRVDGYRIISKTGEIKHLHLNGRYFHKNGRPVSVGVVQDITDNVKTEEDLRARNLELNRTNAELESFNRVASHDLQEPLRKIQMFISRIVDADNKKLSQEGRDYFAKIENAAARMQSLIQNLLTYSGIDRTHQDFEEVNMNVVVNKVKEDFAEEIKEVGAKIESENLPTIQGVAFQMEQLFGNLISNALKYRNTTTVSKIVVRAERVHRNQITGPFTKAEKYYQKISLIDNGIGFSPEYAEKIFEVFQRLHQRAEFSGTGIGLAICKKIVENHHGYIYATSEVGKGAAFVIYLPEVH